MVKQKSTVTIKDGSRDVTAEKRRKRPELYRNENVYGKA